MTATAAPTGNSSNGGVGVAPAQSQFLYGSAGEGVTGGSIQSSGQVLSVATPTNTLSGVTAFETGSGGFTGAIAIDMKGRFLYTSDVATASFGIPIGTNAVGAFTINRSTGVLTRIAGSPYPLAARGGDIAIDGGGRFVYSAQGTSIDIWTVNQTSGALTKTSTMTGVGDRLAASWDGNLLFNSGNGQVASFSINAGSGQLTQVNTVAVGNAGDLFLAYSGRFLYTHTGNTISALAVDSAGRLTMAQSAFAVPFQVLSFGVSPDGRFAYVSERDTVTGAGQVEVYSMNTSSGVLGTKASGLANLDQGWLAVDFTGKFLYLTLAGAPLQTYNIAGDGSLTAGLASQGPVAGVEFFRLSP